MAYAFGKSAGTTTLNYWVSKSGSSSPPTQFASEVKPRKIKLLQILDRLQKLESGLNEDVSVQSRLGYSSSSDLTFGMTGSRRNVSLSVRDPHRGPRTVHG